MEVSPKLLSLGAAFFTMIALACVILTGVRSNQYEKKIVALQNDVASRDKTIEVQKGVFEKLTVQSTDLSGLLDKSQKEQKALQDEISRQKGQVLQVTVASVNWQKAYEAEALAHESDVITPPADGKEQVTRKKVEFTKDFGYIGVDGYTLTEPGFAYVKVSQKRPLKLAIGLFQTADKSWKTVVTSSEENVQVDVGVTGVNPLLLEPKWYEKIGVRADLGGGSGGLAGVAATYVIGKFELGPATWITATDRVEHFFGASLTWHPFQRN